MNMLIWVLWYLCTRLYVAVVVVIQNSEEYVTRIIILASQCTCRVFSVLHSLSNFCSLPFLGWGKWLWCLSWQNLNVIDFIHCKFPIPFRAGPLRGHCYPCQNFRGWGLVFLTPFPLWQYSLLFCLSPCLFDYCLSALYPFQSLKTCLFTPKNQIGKGCRLNPSRDI